MGIAANFEVEIQNSNKQTAIILIHVFYKLILLSTFWILTFNETDSVR